MTGRRHVVPAIVVALLTLAAFLPALQAEFVAWDDNRNFTGNPSYRGLGLDELRWMWSTTLMGHYIPVSWMTLGADYLLWGMDARGYHVTNLLLHCAAAIALYAVIARLFEIRSDLPAGRIRFAAAAGALLFAVHPLRVESVAWVTERRDVLSLAVMLASVLFYLRGRYVAAFAAFLVALLSKASVVTLPIVLLVIEAYPLGRLRGWRDPESRRVWIRLAPFFALSAATGLLSVFVLDPPAQLGLSGKLAVTAYSLRFYTEKTLLPIGLSPLYPMPRVIDPWAGRFVASYLFAVAAVALLVWARRRQPAVAAALVATAALVLPLLGIVQNGPQIAADRYTYHAAAALSVLPALLLVRADSRALRAAVGALIIVLAVLTARQTRHWRDSEALWSRILAVDSTSSVAQFGLGDVRISQGRIEEAIALYARGVALDPGYAEGHNNLGALLARVGRFPEAIAEYEAALRLHPVYPAAELNWGVALARLGQTEEAVSHYRRALEQDSTMKDVRMQLGNALLRLGKRDEAIREYAAEVRRYPTNAIAHLNWGVALAQGGRFSEAIPHFDEALRLDPGLDDARGYRAEAGRRAPPGNGR